MTYENTNKLESMLDRLGDKVDRNAEEVGKLSSKVVDLHKLIAGNGSEGLITKLALIQVELRQEREHRETLEEDLKDAIATVDNLEAMRNKIYGAAVVLGLSSSAVGAVLGKIVLP